MGRSALVWKGIESNLKLIIVQHLVKGGTEKTAALRMATDICAFFPKTVGGQQIHIPTVFLDVFSTAPKIPGNFRNGKGMVMMRKLKEHTVAILVSEGINKSMASSFSTEIVRRLCKHCGGDMIYFPTQGAAAAEFRDTMIYAEWRKGASYSQLAGVFGLTERHIRNVVDREQEKEKAESSQKRASN